MFLYIMLGVNSVIMITSNKSLFLCSEVIFTFSGCSCSLLRVHACFPQLPYPQMKLKETKMEISAVDLQVNRILPFRSRLMHATLNQCQVHKSWRILFSWCLFLVAVCRFSRSHVVLRLCAVIKLPTLLWAKMQQCIMGGAEIYGFTIFWTCILSPLPSPAQCYPWMPQAKVGTKTCWGTISPEY